MAPRVLVVDSDESFRRSLQQRLRELGYEAFASGREETARAQLEGSDFQVVLLGLRGFQRHGLELLEYIRSTWPGVRVITMVPGNRLQLAIEAMKQGAYDDILVPFDMLALLQKIELACRAAGGPLDQEDSRG